MQPPQEPVPAGAEAMSAEAAKKQLRRRIRQDRRDRTQSRDRDPAGYDRARHEMASALSAALVAGLSPTLTSLAARTGSVAVYESLPTEPPTEVLVSRLLESGVAVLLPQVLPDRDLAWRRVGPRPPATTPLDCGPAGPGWPADVDLPPTAIGEAGVVVVPALAVDRHGGRLGQGGGSYDRALPRVRPGTPVVAVVFEDEFVDGPVPTADHDARVDAVLTPVSGLRWLPLPHVQPRE